MEIGPEGPPFVIEPIEDPVPRAIPEPVPRPESVPQPEPVLEPERVLEPEPEPVRQPAGTLAGRP